MSGFSKIIITGKEVAWSCAKENNTSNVNNFSKPTAGSSASFHKFCTSVILMDEKFLQQIIEENQWPASMTESVLG